MAKGGKTTAKGGLERALTLRLDAGLLKRIDDAVREYEKRGLRIGRGAVVRRVLVRGLEVEEAEFPRAKR